MGEKKYGREKGLSEKYDRGEGSMTGEWGRSMTGKRVAPEGRSITGSTSSRGSMTGEWGRRSMTGTGGSMTGEWGRRSMTRKRGLPGKHDM
ncbi:hypothetical protein AMTR_s00025p00143720 [Amborella trichopoda]|uniref:Uncharacterized protein n=1 Tax=Amborella trichopoda TaxID=13333 RepID=W1PWC3_AMBTC|nr:hypothetical protein AMTR_s00025p00143720 [Amborella trichopoda]